MRKTIWVAVFLVIAATSTGAHAFGSAIASGTSHSCVIHGDSLYCSGSNNYGELGFDTGSQPRYTEQLALASGVQQVAVGQHFTCALQYGAVLCIGEGDKGQLGNGGTANHSTWQQVSGLGTVPGDVIEITAGEGHACAIRWVGETTKQLWCWGNNASGQIGDNTLVNKLVPVQIATGESSPQWLQVTAGTAHTCGIVGISSSSYGRAKCWGYNGHGTLGDGTVTTRKLPTQVLRGGVPFDDAADMTAGAEHTCAVAQNTNPAQRVFCWGRNQYGQVTANGVADGADYRVPNQTGMFSVQWFAQGPKANHVCVNYFSTVSGFFEPVCWGKNVNGQAGNGSYASPAASGSTVQVCNPTCHYPNATGVFAVGLESTVIDDNPNLHTHWSWGLNDSGQLGIGQPPPSTYDVPTASFP